MQNETAMCEMGKSQAPALHKLMPLLLYQLLHFVSLVEDWLRMFYITNVMLSAEVGIEPTFFRS